LALVAPARAYLAADHAREVALDRHPVHQGEPGRVADHVHAAAVAAPIRHREPPFGDIDRRDAEPPLDPGAVGLHEPHAGGVDQHRPRRAHRDRTERFAVRVVADEQLAVAAQRDAGGAGREADA